MAVRLGKQDDFLIKAEKAANARGVRELGLVKRRRRWPRGTAQACERGEVKGLYLCGGDLLDVVPADRLKRDPARTRIADRSGFQAFDRITPKPQCVLPTTHLCREGRHLHQSCGPRAAHTEAHRSTARMGRRWRNFHQRFSTSSNRARTASISRGIWASMARDGGRFARLALDEIGPHGAALESAWRPLNRIASTLDISNH